MSTRLLTFAFAILCCLLVNQSARAQAEDAPKQEVGALFSAITFTPSDGYRTEIGVGGRYTFNLTDHVGLEAETIFFPNSGFSAERRASGRAVQAVFGVKAGKRWEKFGLFAKGRPGLISFADGRLVSAGTDASGFTIFRTERATHFAFDVGGVLEFYPTRRIVTRFDVGDTIIRYGNQTTTFNSPFGGGTFTLPTNTRHNLQVNAGIGFRF